MIDSAIDSETAPILARQMFSAVSGLGSVTTAAAITFSSVVAIDQINLRLDLDYNGDSVIDESIPTTWATLGTTT